MRFIATVGIFVLVAMTTGCQIIPTTDNRFTLANEAEITLRPVRFPIVMTYPDNTMFFYPTYEQPPRADLNLRGIDCQTRPDGALAIVARVQNMGSDIITAVPLITTGDNGAFRVLATVTTGSGSQEQVQAVQLIPLTVSSTVVLAFNSTQARASDVTAIDVVADPDRYVPDPIRENNRLSWRGKMDATNATCKVER